MSDAAALLGLYMQIERKSAELYRAFHASCPEDADFWWTLALEEENHAALLRSGREIFLPLRVAPTPLLGVAADDLHEALEMLNSLLERQRHTPLSRTAALATALRVERLAGELHFQNLLEAPPDTRAVQLFQSLASGERDHASRIEAYRQQQGLG